MTTEQTSRYNDVAADVQGSSLSAANKTSLLSVVTSIVNGDASGALSTLGASTLSNAWLLYTFDAASFVGGRPNDRKPNLPG